MPDPTPPPLCRAQLHEAVWSTPVDRLAKRYGISGPGLAKICRRHGIPCPPRGYWAKPAKRRPAPKRLPEDRRHAGDWVLLEFRPQREETTTADGTRPPSPPTDAAPEGPVPAQGAASRPSVPEPLMVRVPATLEAPHALVVKVERALRASELRAPAGVTSLLDTRSEKSDPIDIEVTGAQVDRALRILDALFKALGTRGHALEVDRFSERPKLLIADGQCCFGLRLRELVEYRTRVPTRTERERARNSNGEWRPPERETISTGTLRLDLASSNRMLEKSWKDGRRRRIEDRLGEFILLLEQHAEQQREKWRAELERMRAAEEAERIRKETEERRRQEQARVDALVSEASAWTRSRMVRAYLRTVRARAGDALAEDEALLAWLEGAEEVARRMDPLPRRVPKADAS